MFLVMLFLFSSIPADSVFRNAVSTPNVHGVSSSEDTALDSVKKLVGDLEEIGFGNALDGLIDKILSLNHSAFLFFYADWCHFCSLEKPIVSELEGQYAGKIIFIHLNEAKNTEALNEFSVQGFPSMFLIYGKNEAGYLYTFFNGYKEKSYLQNALDNIIAGRYHSEDWVSVADEETGGSGSFSHHSCSVANCLKNCIKEKKRVYHGHK